MAGGKWGVEDDVRAFQAACEGYEAGEGVGGGTCALEGITVVLRAAGPRVQVVPAQGQGVGAGNGAGGCGWGASFSNSAKEPCRQATR